MRKKLICAFLAAALVCTQFAAFAYEPHFWAEEHVKGAMKASIISEEYGQKPYDSPISRSDFVNVAVNMYATITAEDVCTNPKNPFRDTTDIFPNMAFYAGIISGDGEGNFMPQGTLSRQEMCKMVTNVLSAANVLGVYTPSPSAFNDINDEETIAWWARDYVAFMLDNEIMGGDETGSFKPNDVVTREDAAIVAYRCYIKYAKDVDGTVSTALVPWQDANGNTIYSLVKTVKMDNGMKVALRDADNKTYTDNPGEGEGDNTQQGHDDEIASLPTGAAGYAPSGTPLQTPDEFGLYKLKTFSETLATGEASEKEERIFGGVGNKYTTQDQAEANIVSTTVPVWQLDDNGNLYQSTLTFRINAKLVDDVQAIFKEIFESPQMPPIKDASAYAWRIPMSDHNYGTCIDLNYNENYTIYKNGTHVGSFYDPAKSVYSFPETGVVIQTFAKYGWLWGGNAWVSGTKDYMHFSYLGK